MTPFHFGVLPFSGSMYRYGQSSLHQMCFSCTSKPGNGHHVIYEYEYPLYDDLRSKFLQSFSSTSLQSIHYAWNKSLNEIFWNYLSCCKKEETMHVKIKKQNESFVEITNMCSWVCVFWFVLLFFLQCKGLKYILLLVINWYLVLPFVPPSPSPFFCVCNGQWMN